MYKIGLTGGIASGKSTVLDWFKDKNVAYIDADVVARQIVEPGQPALGAIREAFGEKVIQADGQLDRRALGDIVFHDDQERARLDAIVKQYLREAFDERTKEWEAAGAKACIYDVPLLIEHGYYQAMDEVWLVYVKPEVQLGRLMARNSLSREDAQARIDSQMKLDDKRVYAQEIIDNSEDQESLYEHLSLLWDKKKYLFGK